MRVCCVWQLSLFPVIVLSHMTNRVAFTHAMRASHQADIRDWEVPGGPSMVMWAVYDQVETESALTIIWLSLENFEYLKVIQ